MKPWNIWKNSKSSLVSQKIHIRGKCRAGLTWNTVLRATTIRECLGRNGMELEVLRFHITH